MNLLVSDDVLRARSAVAGAELEPLARGLMTELTPVFTRDLYLPREKALLSREGGRCSRDGATLEFDPFSPHKHRCPICGDVYTGVHHDRFWIFWYQLWLAERAVHGALLARLRCEESARMLAIRILERYCDEYLLYANRDNVLGPTRLFFSTYLESIWLLNICIALDLLESNMGSVGALGSEVRERIIEPSAAIIASYDEGASNRQVWNDAALLAANLLLGRPDRAARAVFDRSGISYHLERGLLPDGTWYEGENYHLFAHRGLWYGVTMAESAGMSLPRHLLDRFQEAFATPFLTALPDMTLPSRRDSRYKISLRQSRFAELCELGLARQQGDGDRRLRGVLYRLYREEWPRGDTGRTRTTADVERNLAGTSLTRADLGWRSLLFARPELPALTEEPLGTVLLEAQGLAVFRRQRGQVYVALDYGTSGGGHGHPDRLNVLLSDGPTRWLDDMGTGSYVDPSLHWYRSTLAHNAPLFNGYEQLRVDGELFAFDEHAEFGWVSARALNLLPGVAAMRSLVVMPDYVVDELAWYAEETVVMDLPIHVSPTSLKIRHSGRDRRGSFVHLGEPLEDTLNVLHDAKAEWLGAHSTAKIVARDGDRALDGFILPSYGSLLYHVVAPGPPGSDEKPMLLLRLASTGGSKSVRIVWSWSDAIADVRTDSSSRHLFVERRDGSVDDHRHTVSGWRVDRRAGGTVRAIEFGGVRRKAADPYTESQASDGNRVFGGWAYEPKRADTVEVLKLGIVSTFQLGGDQYRASEETWEEAGRPSARVGLLAMPHELVVDLSVHKQGTHTFVPGDALNPYDNEAPDINGDGTQLYLVDDDGASGWVLVPETRSEGIRARLIEGWNTPRDLRGEWQRIPDGYTMRVRIAFPTGDLHDREIALGVVVNEKPFGRERRRGQLVLGGSPGEFVYLRGDREDRRRLRRFRVAP